MYILVIFLVIVVLAYRYISSGKPAYLVEGEKRIFAKLPSQAYIFFMAVKKSMIGKRSKSIEMPKLCFVQKLVQFDSSHIAKYRDICGFSVKDNDVPLSYPYLIIFSLQALLLIDEAFPFQAMGLVHLANRIQQFGKLSVDTRVNVHVQFDPVVTPHDKGYCFTVISQLFSESNELLWRCESTYLFRTKVKSATGQLYESKIKPEDVEGVTENRKWELAENFGRKYAAVSGDYNPIHLYGFTAKLFGFPHGCIMHGMWTVAACCAELMTEQKPIKQTTKTPVAEIYVELKMPMYLPAKPTLLSKAISSNNSHVVKNQTSNNVVFEVMVKNKKDTVPHLRGTCSWA